MTKQKDLKKRIRARQQKTGESYTAARAQVLGSAVQIPEAPSATAEARAEGFRCEAVVSESLRQLGDLRPLFARLRTLLESLDVEACGPLLRGEPIEPRMPKISDFVEARRFVLSDELGLSRDGRSAALSWNGRVVIANFALLRKPLMQLGLRDEAKCTAELALLGIGR
jgi:hypothetical protein